MDNSKEYILMCERFVEVTKYNWKPKKGDIVADDVNIAEPGEDVKLEKQIFIVKVATKELTFLNMGLELITYSDGFSHGLDLITIHGGLRHGMVPLFRQDQLQTMIGDFDDCLNLIDRFDSMSSIAYDYPDLKSMEQLWLAFVMKEKYNKIWNGKDWIKGEL